MTHFFVPGTSAPQGSKRHVGNGRMIEMSKALPAWRNAVTTHARAAWAGRPPLDAPAHITVVFYVTRPKKPRFPLPAVRTGGDTDKLQRAVGDALERAGVLTDDARITHWDARKRYTQPGAPTGAAITIKEDHPDDQ